MHIPDGYLDAKICIATYAVVIVYALYTWRVLRKKVSQYTLLSASVLAAGIFVAQMIAWPIPGGTSLHLLGAALAGILFGPLLGFYVMSLVLVVQALVFHDGGITTLGANILNMGIVGVVPSYYCFRLLQKLLRGREKWRIVAGFVAGWTSLTLAGVATGLELGLSSVFPYSLEISLAVMSLWHAVLGVVEGLITGFTVEYLYRVESPIVKSSRVVLEEVHTR